MSEFQGNVGIRAVFSNFARCRMPHMEFVGEVIIIRTTCGFNPRDESAPSIVRLHDLKLNTNTAVSLQSAKHDHRWTPNALM